MICRVNESGALQKLAVCLTGESRPGLQDTWMAGLGANSKACVDPAAGAKKRAAGGSGRPQVAVVPLALQPRHVQGHFLREMPLTFPLTAANAPPRASTAACDREEEAFDPAAHEWQKPGEGRRRGSRSVESRAINLSHEHVPLTSGLATSG